MNHISDLIYQTQRNQLPTLSPYILDQTLFQLTTALLQVFEGLRDPPQIFRHPNIAHQWQEAGVEKILPEFRVESKFGPVGLN